jgi:hypothetical protein
MMMIFILFVLLFLVVAIKQALTYSTWRHQRMVSSSSFLHPTSRQRLDSTTCKRSERPSLRSFTTFLSSKPRSTQNPFPAKFDALEKELGALKHLLKGGNSTTASENIRESVLIYEGSDKKYLRDMIKDLQREKSELQREKSALQEKETALIISQAAVESKGTLRWNRIETWIVVLRSNFLPNVLPPSQVPYIYALFSSQHFFFRLHSRRRANFNPSVQL